MPILLLSRSPGAVGTPRFAPGRLLLLLQAATAGPIRPLDLVDAVEAYLLATIAPGRLQWIGAGALPPGLGLPFASIGSLEEEADYQEDGSGHAPFDDLGSFAVRIAAATSSQAKSLSSLVSKTLTDAPLNFSDGGTLLLIRRTSRAAPVLEDEDAPLGEQTWISHLLFTTIVSRML